MNQKKLLLNNETLEKFEEFIEEKSFTTGQAIEYLLSMYEKYIEENLKENKDILKRINELIVLENKVNLEIKIIKEALNKFFYGDSELFLITDEAHRPYHKYILEAEKKVKEKLKQMQAEKYMK